LNINTPLNQKELKLRAAITFLLPQLPWLHRDNYLSSQYAKLNKCPSDKNPVDKSDLTHQFRSCVFDSSFVWNIGNARLSNGKAKWAKIEIYGVPEGPRSVQVLSRAQPDSCVLSVTDLDGWFAGDVRDQEVHGNVLAVYVVVHHVPDGLGHHVGVQVGVVLQQAQTRRETSEPHCYETATKSI